jgi:hypothetical protein
MPINRCEGGFLCLLLKSGRDLMPINKCEGGFLCLLLKSGRDLMPINRCKTRKDIDKCRVFSNPLIIHLNTIVTKMYYQMVKPRAHYAR